MKKNIKKITLSFTLLLTLALIGATSSDYKSKFTLGSTNWQGTKAYDSKGNDVTDKNRQFIGLAKYDDKSNHYEFFTNDANKESKQKGIFFVTQDGSKRIIKPEPIADNSAAPAYIVDMLELTPKLFSYKRNGTDQNGNQTIVTVEHIPYDGDLTTTYILPSYTKTTGPINTDEAGRDILGSTLWIGTVAIDENGNDVSEFNRGFLGLARYDSTTSKYEFFHADSGKSRGDYGYYDVIMNNKARVHVAIDKDKPAYSNVKYFAERELTELNKNKFTYAATGNLNAENPPKKGTIYVEHVPYAGEYPLEFTF